MDYATQVTAIYRAAMRRKLLRETDVRLYTSLLQEEAEQVNVQVEKEFVLPVQNGEQLVLVIVK